MEFLFSADALAALFTLIILEIVLGVDNIIFISILVSKLQLEEQNQARYIGLALALITRILLLFSLGLIMKLTSPLFTIMSNNISGRDLILIIGGLFLLAKSTHEIHNKLEGEEGSNNAKAKSQFISVIIQIAILDIVFSLDSVITAIGMASDLSIIVIAIIVSIIFMMIFAKKIGDFVENHPTIKMLALSFLLMIGIILVAEGLDQHIPKGYIYFAMAFSFFVEVLNIRMRKSKVAPIHLRKEISE